MEGADLKHELELAPWQLVLGGEVTVPTMEGSAMMKLPAGSQPGARFRLKGRGLPKTGGGRGDIYVVLSLLIPKTLTPKQKELWKALSEAK